MTSLYGELHDPEPPAFCTRCNTRHDRYWCAPKEEKSEKDDSEEE